MKLELLDLKECVMLLFKLLWNNDYNEIWISTGMSHVTVRDSPLSTLNHIVQCGNIRSIQKILSPQWWGKSQLLGAGEAAWNGSYVLGFIGSVVVLIFCCCCCCWFFENTKFVSNSVKQRRQQSSAHEKTTLEPFFEEEYWWYHFNAAYHHLYIYIFLITPPKIFLSEKLIIICTSSTRWSCFPPNYLYQKWRLPLYTDTVFLFLFCFWFCLV